MSRDTQNMASKSCSTTEPAAQTYAKPDIPKLNLAKANSTKPPLSLSPNVLMSKHKSTRSHKNK